MRLNPPPPPPHFNSTNPATVQPLLIFFTHIYYPEEKDIFHNFLTPPSSYKTRKCWINVFKPAPCGTRRHLVSENVFFSVRSPRAHYSNWKTLKVRITLNSTTITTNYTLVSCFFSSGNVRQTWTMPTDLGKWKFHVRDMIIQMTLMFSGDRAEWVTHRSTQN